MDAECRDKQLGRTTVSEVAKLRGGPKIRGLFESFSRAEEESGWDEADDWDEEAGQEEEDVWKRPCVGDLLRVITTKDERSGLTGKLIEDDGSDQPFHLVFDGSPPRQDGNEDWFGSDEVEQLGKEDQEEEDGSDEEDVSEDEDGSDEGSDEEPGTDVQETEHGFMCKCCRKKMLLCEKAG